MLPFTVISLPSIQALYISRLEHTAMSPHHDPSNSNTFLQQINSCLCSCSWFSWVAKGVDKTNTEHAPRLEDTAVVLAPITSMTQATKSCCNGTFSIRHQFIQSRPSREGTTSPRRFRRGSCTTEDLTNPCKSVTATDKLSLEKWNNETCYFRDQRGFYREIWEIFSDSCSGVTCSVLIALYFH